MEDLNANTRVQASVVLGSLDANHEGAIESEGDESGTADSESFANCGSGVS
jgi:hypothetical protein